MVYLSEGVYLLEAGGVPSKSVPGTRDTPIGTRDTPRKKVPGTRDTHPYIPTHEESANSSILGVQLLF